VPSVDELQPVIESYVLEVREALVGDDPRRARATFGALLGERRMEVRPDAEMGFRVEGLFRLAIESENARRPQQIDGRLDMVVAGGDLAESRQSWRSCRGPRSGSAPPGWVTDGDPGEPLRSGTASRKTAGIVPVAMAERLRRAACGTAGQRGA